MKRFFRSLVPGGSRNQPDETPGGDREASSAETPDPGAARTASGTRLSPDEILVDLVAHICSTMPDPRAPDEIDAQIHMYDAGYLTSITAADLLAHIDARYGLDISETQLIGPLQNLAALSKYVESES